MKKIAVLALLMVLILFASAGRPTAEGKEGEITPLQVIVVDVGHGDCIWIKTPDDGIEGNGKCEGYNIIIDAGPSSKRIVPLLTGVGFRYGTPIDWMVNTHAHNDHYRGLIGLLQDFKVRNIIDPGYLHTGQAYSAFCWKALIEPGGTFYSPVIGIPSIPGLKSLSQSVPCQLDWGKELDVEILYSNPAVNEATVNNSSIIIRLNYNLISFLFTGDAEGKYRGDSAETGPIYVEKFLLDKYVNENENKLKSTILKIGHHGSETSSTLAFIEAVNPREGIICAGNRHGLPDETVIKRFQNNGCRVWRTDRLDEGKSGSECHGDDDIIITTNGTDYQISYLKPDSREGLNDE